MASNVFDVVCCVPFIFNEDIFDFWIDGLPVEEVARKIQSLPQFEVFGLSSELLIASVSDQYSEFTLLESAMAQPDVFVSCSSAFINDWKLRRKLVERYYSLDVMLCREFIGSKLSARFRRDLADTADRCGLRLSSCRRQYENLRRVARIVEDKPGRLCDIIRRHFALSTSLAELYASIIFLSVNRFETSKRCFAGASFADFTYCAEQLMTYWTPAAAAVAAPFGSMATSATAGEHTSTAAVPGGRVVDCPLDLELDIEFCSELKLLKLITEKLTYLQRHKSLVIRQISSLVSGSCLAYVEANFKTLSKAITSIATGLSHAKEVRDFFVDIVEKVIELVVGAQWTYQEFSSFLTSFDETLRVLPPAKDPSNFLRSASGAQSTTLVQDELAHKPCPH